MADTPEMEVNEMDQVTEDAATGVAAIKKGAKSGEKIDTSGAKHTDIGGSDSKSNPEGTENLGAKAAAPVGVEGDKSIKTKPSLASAKMEETDNGEEETIADPSSK